MPGTHVPGTFEVPGSIIREFFSFGYFFGGETCIAYTGKSWPTRTMCSTNGTKADEPLGTNFRAGVTSKTRGRDGRTQPKGRLWEYLVDTALMFSEIAPVYRIFPPSRQLKPWVRYLIHLQQDVSCFPINGLGLLAYCVGNQ